MRIYPSSLPAQSDDFSVPTRQTRRDATPSRRAPVMPAPSPQRATSVTPPALDVMAPANSRAALTAQAWAAAGPATIAALRSYPGLQDVRESFARAQATQSNADVQRYLDGMDALLTHVYGAARPDSGPLLAGIATQLERVFSAKIPAGIFLQANAMAAAFAGPNDAPPALYPHRAALQGACFTLRNVYERLGQWLETSATAPIDGPQPRQLVADLGHFDSAWQTLLTYFVDWQKYQAVCLLHVLGQDPAAVLTPPKADFASGEAAIMRIQTDVRAAGVMDRLAALVHLGARLAALRPDDAAFCSSIASGLGAESLLEVARNDQEGRAAFGRAHQLAQGKLADVAAQPLAPHERAMCEALAAELRELAPACFAFDETQAVMGALREEVLALGPKRDDRALHVTSEELASLQASSTSAQFLGRVGKTFDAARIAEAIDLATQEPDAWLGIVNPLLDLLRTILPQHKHRELDLFRRTLRRRVAELTLPKARFTPALRLFERARSALQRAGADLSTCADPAELHALLDAKNPPAPADPRFARRDPWEAHRGALLAALRALPRGTEPAVDLADATHQLEDHASPLRPYLHRLDAFDMTARRLVELRPNDAAWASKVHRALDKGALLHAAHHGDPHVWRRAELLARSMLRDVQLQERARRAALDAEPREVGTPAESQRRDAFDSNVEMAQSTLDDATNPWALLPLVISFVSQQLAWLPIEREQTALVRWWQQNRTYVPALERGAFVERLRNGSVGLQATRAWLQATRHAATPPVTAAAPVSAKRQMTDGIVHLLTGPEVGPDAFPEVLRLDAAQLLRLRRILAGCVQTGAALHVGDTLLQRRGVEATHAERRALTKTIVGFVGAKRDVRHSIAAAAQAKFREILQDRHDRLAPLWQGVLQGAHWQARAHAWALTEAEKAALETPEAADVERVRQTLHHALADKLAARARAPQARAAAEELIRADLQAAGLAALDQEIDTIVAEAADIIDYDVQVYGVFLAAAA